VSAGLGRQLPKISAQGSRLYETQKTRLPGGVLYVRMAITRFEKPLKVDRDLQRGINSARAILQL
jgi:hypothetical protein